MIELSISMSKSIINILLSQAHKISLMSRCIKKWRKNHMEPPITKEGKNGVNKW